LKNFEEYSACSLLIIYFLLGENIYKAPYILTGATTSVLHVIKEVNLKAFCTIQTLYKRKENKAVTL